MIHRGVSLYCYQQAEWFGEMTWKDQLREVATNLDGADGIEIVSEATIYNYPMPDEKFYFEWNNEIARWGLKPVAYDAYMDVLQFRNHLMTYAECAEHIKTDLRIAKRMGFGIVRLVHNIPLEAIEMALPLAEELDIKMTNEIHDPTTIKVTATPGLPGGRSDRTAQDVAFAQKHNTRHYGLQPDMSIFAARPNRLRVVGHLSKFMDYDAANALFWETMQVREEQSPEASLEYFRKRMPKDFLSIRPDMPGFGDPLELMFLPQPACQPEDLYDIAPYIFCFHGKFYDMSEDPKNPGQYREYSMLYREVIDVLKGIGYDGYINSEYEGQRDQQKRGDEHLVDERVEVRHHQEMMKRLIGA